MKKQQHLTFRHALKQYKRYKRKYGKLAQSGTTGAAKLEFLTKRILRLKTFLMQALQRAKLAASVGAVGLVLSASSAEAQTFLPPVNNPFGISVSYTYALTNATVDLDNDGDLDLLAGDISGAFTYYENTGTSTSPAFAAGVSNPFGLTAASYASTVTFADFDNDGDLDLLCSPGTIYGGDTFLYYENTGTASSPAFAAPVSNPFGLVPGGDAYSYNFMATAGDLDNDGDLDLMVGDYNEYQLFYYENTGTASAPAFAALVTDPFGLNSASDVPRYAAPAFSDMDNDGDLDLLLGSTTGDFLYYENTGTASAPAFAVGVSNPFSLASPYYNKTSPSFGDLDGDGDLDLLAGTYSGGFFYYEREVCTLPSAPSNTTPAASMAVCSGNSTTLTASGTGTISWYDATSGGTYLGSGTTFTTPVLTSGATYYAQDSTCGAGPRTAVAVTVNPLPDATTTYTGGSSIMANFSGGTYQWVTCPTYVTASGSSTGQTYTVPSGGDYAVVVSDGTCSDTSACVTVVITGMAEITTPQHLLVYPNPNNGIFTIQAPVAGNYALRNEVGQVIQTFTLNNSNRYTLTLEGLSNGIYFITGANKETVSSMKIVVAK